MYISEIEIQNFRNFPYILDINGKEAGIKINFNEGVNVIIGHNNSGKTNLLKALELVLNHSCIKKLEIEDFNKNTKIEKLIKDPPKTIISVTFSESEKEDEFSEDLVTASTWLTKLESPYSAKLTYNFYLPQKEHKEYNEAMSLIKSSDINDYWLAIKHQFLKKYVSKIYSGNPEYKNVVDSDSLKRIDFQYLEAIRDVERDLFTGKNALLREVIDFFIDYDIKNSKDINKKDQLKQIADKKKDFSRDAQKLIDQLQERMLSGKKEMLNYAYNTGASFENSEPDFDGHILDTELYSALKLIVRLQTGITIPATHNGLGYNNLIFISLLLAKMQKDASGDYLGSNAKTFPVLAIEEPEAHLHPAMQYKFLKFLKENRDQKTKQIFITTHSPSITSAVDLDNIICFSRNNVGNLNVAYLGKAFTKDENNSKTYVQRFLDATKSDMLFAKSVLLVEGISEQLLVPVFAEYLKKNLETEHVSIINIGGRYFNHFLKLFDSNKPNTIHKKVVCLTDLDPVYRENGNSPFEKCYPFEKSDDIEFKDCSNHLVDEYSEGKHPNIVCFSQDKGFGKTFEYAIAYENSTCDLYAVDCISNKEKLKELIKANATDESLDKLINIFDSKGNENLRIIASIHKSKLEKDVLKKHLIATRYLNSLSKGENAYELTKALLGNLPENKANFQVPVYIKKAIDWICK